MPHEEPMTHADRSEERRPYFDGTIHYFQRTQSFIGAVEGAVHQLEDAGLLASAMHGSRAYRASILQLLSSGFEHMMKVILLMGYEERGEQIPNVRKLSHDLLGLRDAVATLCDHAGYTAERAWFRDDVDFLRSDKRFNLLLRLVSDYGSSTRYLNLDTMARGGSEDWRPPEFYFQDIKDDILGSDPRYLPNFNGGNDWSWVYPLYAEQLLYTIQRAARAFCRMFVHDLLGQPGKTMTGVVLPFARLDDHELTKLVASARIDDLATRP